MIVGDEIVWIAVFFLCLFLTFLAYDHNPFASGQEIGYAQILTWIKATGFMLLSVVVWIALGLMTFTLNNCSWAFAACFTGTTMTTPTVTVTTDAFAIWLPWLFIGVGLINLVVGMVMTMYLVLPIDRLPKGLLRFSQQSERSRTSED
jgi:hypothetical protein